MSSSGSSIVSRINEPELMDVGYPRGFARAAAPRITMVRSAMALPQLLAGAPSNATTWPLHRTKRGSLSRVAATFLPIGHELRLGLSHGRRAPMVTIPASDRRTP
jgi:hypothetical protein